jgi:hypothetical protein
MTAAPPPIPTANWTGSVQILPTIMQAFKSQIHINLNEATTNALQAVGTNSILSLILYHFITFISAICI